VFLMTPSMISKVSGLQTRISRTVQQVEFEGGFRFASYRGIPLVPATNLTHTAASPTLTATIAAGGALATQAWYYSIASVTENGEQLCSAEATATSATTNNKVNLTWTADANAKLYKIYRGSTTGIANHFLLAVIPAKTYDGDGALSTNVAAWSDDGSLTPSAVIKPTATSGDEQIFLINMSNERGYGVVGKMSPLGERTDQFFSYIPLATRKSAYEFMIEGFLAGIARYPELNIIAKRARLA
jgi:hypothetical protein